MLTQPPPLDETYNTLILEMVESRVIAHLKAKSEKHAVDDLLCPGSPGFREEKWQ